MKTHFLFSAAFLRPYLGGILVGLALVVFGTAPAAAATLGISSLLVGPTAGSNSVTLVVPDLWSATTTYPWLHVAPGSLSGSGNKTIVFSYDANTGLVRSGTLTIQAGSQTLQTLTLTVTQAGSAYVSARILSSSLANISKFNSNGVAVNATGDVYVADANTNLVKWVAATGQTQRLYGPLPYTSGGVAVDAIGNAYIADSSNVLKFSENTGVSSFLTVPTLITLDALGVDSEGNLYVGDVDTSQITKFLSSDNSQSVLVSGGVIVNLTGLAVDAAGNIFISDNYHQMIQEWQVANGQIIPIVETGVDNVMGIAVDGSGNLFIADNGNNAVKEWVAASKTLITLLPPNQVSAPLGVTLDTSGNLYITAGFGLQELSYAFVDPTPKMITTPNAGTGSVAPVLPATINLAHAFPPHFDQSWINITGITNGVISFAFSANTGDHRSANLNLLGVNIPFIQDGLASFSLGYYDRCEGPLAGADYVILATTLPTDPWTATANVNWLHVVNNQSGNGSGNIEFTYDANAGATRTGTLTIANHTVTITQAGAAYVAAPDPFTSLVGSGLNNPAGIAVDGFGNVYIADTMNNAIKEWTPANNSVRTLVSTGLSNPGGVAVDVSGNVYIADTGHNAVKEWLVASQAVTTLVSSGLAGPGGVAVNASGNVYIADTINNTIKVWNPANNTLTSVVSSGLAGPLGVATDVAGNVYIADTQNSAIKKWTAGGNLVSTVVASGLNLPKGVAVDGAGNIYIADTLNQAVKKWSAVNFSVSNLSSTGLNLPQGVAADVAGNVYIGDTGNNVIKEQPRAFVDPTPHNVFGPSATDVLSVVLPTYENLLAPFHPSSDQSWLTIGSINNGVVGFGFAANPGVTRSGNLTVLGQVIPVTQYRQAVLGTSSLLVGPGTGSNGVVLANVGQPWGATAIAAWLHLSAANQAGSGSTNVIFSYDANPGITRTGALSICGFNVIITQTGSTYVPAPGPITALVPSGLSNPQGAAVDGVGNLYLADAGNNAIKKWSRANNSVSTIVSSGLSNPKGVAVDGAGNVYIADTGHNSIKEWVAAGSSVTTLISSGLNGPSGIAVDGATNIYIADTTNNAIKKWTASGNILTTLVSSGLSHPAAVTVDVAGNLYIADSQDNAVKKWALVNGSLSTLAAGLNAPGAVAVDGSGNVFFADTANSAIKEWLVATGTVTNLITSALSLPGGAAVDAAGDLFLADSGNGLIKELPHAFVDSAPKMESGRAGSDVSVVLPATADLLAPFAPSSDQSWLSIGSITNGVVGFNYAANPGALRSANLTVLGVDIPIIQYRLPYFGSPTLVEGPAAGLNSIILVAPLNAPWTNVANAAWLHLGASSQMGSGNTNIIFSSDANPGPTRIGTLSVGNQTLTITQAGATYAAAGPLTPLISSGLNFPGSVALDGAGNMYVADQGNSAIKEWVLTNNSVTQIAQGYFAHSLAADVAGNVYFNSDADQSVLECAAGTHAISTLASGVGSSSGVAVDGPGNVYFTVGSSVEEEVAASHALTTPVSGSSGSGPLAVDVAGNLYIANTGIQEWLAGNNTLITLDGSGATSLAVDVSGNIYFTLFGLNSIGKWTAANNTLIPFFNTQDPTSVAVDAAGNIYFSNFTSNLVQELPFAFVDATPRSEGAAAGSDVLPAVLPATVNLLAPFAPASDQPWLVITGATNGVVSFTFTANSGFSRVGRITVLGQSIPITQAGVSQFVLGLTARCVGPLAASESVVLFSANLPWTATANASWLHVAAGSQSGTKSTNVFYSCDANTGTTRSGTLTIAGQTLTVTQAGPNYVAPPDPGATVIPAGVINPGGITVDGSGNVLAISSNPLLAKWNAASNTIATFPAQIQISAGGLAVDAAGNVYFANGFGSVLQEWLAADQTIINLVTSNLSSPKGVAVDSTGNVYIADSGHNAIKKWIAANNTVTTLVASGLNNPSAVAVDVAGNVYITDTGNTTVKKWNAANGALTTVIGVGLLNPGDVAVDGAGNVYVADTGNNAIKRWTAASNAVTTLISTPAPAHVAADNSGGVYFTVTSAGNTLIQELPRAFVTAAAITESPNEGIDSLPVVLPVTTRLLAPFAPTNDQPWLTLHPPNNGVVSFDFTINTNSAARTNHLTVLSQSITITQAGTAGFFLGTAARCEGPAAGRDSVSLFGASGVAWTATANASWLHLVTGSQSGTGGTNVIFTYDANPGATRTGMLTIAGNTVTVIQAGATFVQAPFTLSAPNVLATTPLVTTLAGLAADNAGNVFFVDSGAKTLLKWTAANNTVTTVVSAGLSGPTGVAVDPLGNVYTCGNNQAIVEWRAADNAVTNLVLASANNLAVDGVGNLYFTSSSGLKKWTATNKTVAPLVIPGLVNPWAVAVDAAANLYFIELGSNPSSVKKWTAASQALSTIIPSGLSAPYGLSVDGAGNIYIADAGQNALLKWIAASGVLTNLNSNLSSPQGVAVDATGNIFVTTSTSLLDLPFAYVNLAAGKTEGPGAGSDTISVVLPATAQLMPPFTPTDNVDWLAITGAGSGAFSFAFNANRTPATRQATLNVFNQLITIFQAAPPNLLGAVKVTGGTFKFQIGNLLSNASFTVLASTDASLPLAQWSLVGTATNITSGLYQFTDPHATNSQTFYSIRLNP